MLRGGYSNEFKCNVNSSCKTYLAGKRKILCLPNLEEEILQESTIYLCLTNLQEEMKILQVYTDFLCLSNTQQAKHARRPNLILLCVPARLHVYKHWRFQLQNKWLFTNNAAVILPSIGWTDILQEPWWARFLPGPVKSPAGWSWETYKDANWSWVVLVRYWLVSKL